MSHLTRLGEMRLGCRIWPLTTGDDPNNVTVNNFGWTPTIGTSDFRLVIHAYGLNISSAGSLTMRSHLYRPTHLTLGEEEEFSFYQPCEDTEASDFPPSLLCNTGFVPAIYKGEEVVSVYSYSPFVNVTVTFESMATIAEKLCQFWRRFGEPGYSIAVYDVEYDAETAACPQFNLSGGAFSRVKLIKKINEHYLNVEKGERVYNECMASAY
ncbi:uncharacterized protein LOC144134815 [Amblyomma americanum]